MRRMRRKREIDKFDVNLWQPRTGLGRAVKEGKMTKISEVFRTGKPIMESGIVEALVPNMEEEILGIKLVQRMHKSGRRVKYQIVGVVGNLDGVVGVGSESAQAIGPAIRKTMNAAKMNIVEVMRGCGSWECGCGRTHSVPLEVEGKSGSVTVAIKPAPRGLGIAAAEIPRKVMRMAGIRDAWTATEGETRTTLNFALATLNALKQTTKMGQQEKVARAEGGEQGG
ncbi:MAG: 30S ribosomal protein S5 [Candidatus Hadarchaeota archaeon]